MENKDVKYCAITEQGDLGLGACVLSDEDQEVMQEAAKKEDK